MINVQVIDNTEQIKSALQHVASNTTIFNDEIQALNAVEKLQPSVVLLSYEVRQQETADYIKLILAVSSNSKIVVIADELSEIEILNCLMAGAKGYQDIKQLKVYANKLVKAVDAGEAWITRRMVAILLDNLREK